MLLSINPDYPEGRKIHQVVKTLEEGGIIAYPTDTVYALGCDIQSHKAVEQICRLRKIDPQKARLSMICKDISQAAEYTKQIDNRTFRLLKDHTPGPITFVFLAGAGIPRLFRNRKKTIGIRVPDNKIALAILEELGEPIMSSTLLLPCC